MNDKNIKNKQKLLKNLAELRRLDKQNGMSRIYKQVGDFHGGIYDTWGHISPWSKSACNHDARVMVVAQDWTSEEATKKPPKNINLGYDPDLPTNKNLQNFLKDFFNLSFSEVYATNLFVFVKPGNLSARIPSKDLIYSAKNYTLEEVKIVQPKIVICLGAATYRSLCRAVGVKPPVFKSSIENPISFGSSLIFGVPHTGALGTMNAGGIENVRAIWSRLVTKLENV